MKYLFLIIALPLSLFSKTITLNLHYCTTEEERAWGVMNVPYLPEDDGVLFISTTPGFPSFWMFNCLIDLSVAFIDKDKIIQEIHDLKAYPMMMDPKRPIKTLEDLNLYPPEDPVRKFFALHGKQAKHPTLYALEVPIGWFKKHNVNIGDAIIWEENSPVGHIHTKE
ncbi:MAG: DUF192 domain-containing protein [Chlamydiales bacterium]|nr:DUF192 domain-containing protein [Chlamydiales bacterium]